MSPPQAAIANTEAIIQAIRPRLTRVIIFLNGKGGTGKTTLTGNTAANLAAAMVSAQSNRRILAIDFDPQGNLALDLRYATHPENDQGGSIDDLIRGRGQLRIIRDVRPQLDVVPGGEQLGYVRGSLFSAGKMANGREPRLSFAYALAQVAHEYEWILIDCPPGEPELQDLAAVAGRFVMVPCKFDEGSIDGLSKVSSVFEAARALNGELELLGVALFGFGRTNLRTQRDADGEAVGVKEVGQVARVRARITKLLQEAGIEAPVLDSVITDAPVIAEMARRFGWTFAEIADQAVSEEWRKEARQTGFTIAADSAETAAAEHEALTAEVIAYAQKAVVPV
ncbi:ParA family protein [Microbispora sp. NPDC049125]|uniref:ParA family protein n=1 Tax=Microbispora sp. NPDC049125 TaxID=3154929 RepID=UPI0034657438